MKKFGILSLVLIIALGSLGFVYAMWSDTITINGTVNTGSVCWEFVQLTGASPDDDPDLNCFYDLNLWNGTQTSWIIQTGWEEWQYPFNYPEDYPKPDGKDVGHTYVEIESGVEHPHVMWVTIEDGYPYYYTHVAYKVHYCGTIPGRILKADIKIDDVVVATFDADSASEYVYLDFDTPKATFDNPGFEDTEYELEFWWGNMPYFGRQLHYCQSLDHSFEILVRQPAPQSAGVDGSGVPPMVFTIEYTIVQWDEYD